MQSFEVLTDHRRLGFQAVLDQVEPFCGDFNFHLKRLVAQAQPVAEIICVVYVPLPKMVNPLGKALDCRRIGLP